MTKVVREEIEARLWETIECDRALYVDRGKTVILCDRLPSPVTLVVLRTHAIREGK